MWSKETMMYVAGLLEGEGYFTTTSVRGIRYPRIGCDMSDLDVIEDLQKLLGCGTITSRHRTVPKNRKPIYMWRLLNKEQVKVLLVALRPFMKSRRKGQIDRLLPLCDYVSPGRKNNHRKEAM